MWLNDLDLSYQMQVMSGSSTLHIVGTIFINCLWSIIIILQMVYRVSPN